MLGTSAGVLSSRRAYSASALGQSGMAAGCCDMVSALAETHGGIFDLPAEASFSHV